jgi:uncharacterized coiled-coil DUF342 family protein
MAMVDVSINAPTEGEMNAFLDTYNRMRNALIEGSKLSQEFASFKQEMETARDNLSKEIEGLRQELARVRNQNTALDEALVHSRHARDEANRRLGELEQVLHERNATIQSLERDKQAAQNANAHLVYEVDQLRKERDDAQFKVLELSEENEQLKLHLGKITESMDALNKVLHPVVAKEPEPLKEEVRQEIAEVKAEAEGPLAQGGTTTQSSESGEGGTTESGLSGQAEQQQVHPIQATDGSGDWLFEGKRYPSEREARAAAQPRTHGGQFTRDNGEHGEYLPIAAAHDPYSWR